MAYDVEQNGGAFDRGVAAGEIAQRLKEHDRHFDLINGSLGDLSKSNQQLRTDLVSEVGRLRLEFQRLTDAMIADRATVVTTAEAVEKERASTAKAVEDQRTTLRDTTERRWSPLTRAGVAAGAAAALAAVVAAVVRLLQG